MSDQENKNNKADDKHIMADISDNRYDMDANDDLMADDLSGQLSNYDYDDDDDDEYNYLTEDQEFEYEAPKVTFSELVEFCNGDEKFARRALRQGKRAVEAGASVPIDVKPAIALNKSPEVGAAKINNKQIER